MENSTQSNKSIINKIQVNRSLVIYISILACIATILMSYLFKSFTINDYVLLVIFSFLSAIAETFLILLPRVGAISVSFALGFSAILLTNPLSAAIIAAFGVAFRCPYVDGKGRVHIFNSP
ncbi:MAG: hypothetical protein K0R07_1629, partial [Sedimentibacter sp.]|nr:hypothetical protein [Sedimentibacter sp.]